MSIIISPELCPHCHHLHGHYQHVRHTCPTCYGSGQVQCNHYPTWDKDYFYCSSTSTPLFGSSCETSNGVTCVTSWGSYYPPICYHTCSTCHGAGSIWTYEWVNELWTCPWVTKIHILPCEKPKQDINDDEPCFQQGLGVNKKRKCL
jgi:RecJ-like exonuclease